MRRTSLAVAMATSCAGPLVYEIADQGHTIYVGSTTVGSRWRLLRHRRAGKDWPLANYFRRLSDADRERIEVILRTPEEIAEELGTGPLTLRAAETALQKHTRPELCKVWATNETQPSLFEAATVSDKDPESRLRPDGSWRRE